MKLKAKLILVTNIIVLICVVLTTIYTIYDIKRNAAQSIAVYETEEMEKIKQHIKDIVGISYEMISMSYRSTQNMDLIEKLYGKKLEGTSNDVKELVLANVKENVLYMTLEDLRVLRHSGDGYIWISDNTPPYRVVMNPAKPELEGHTLDGPEYNLIKGTKQNIYEAFADLCAKYGEGFLEYDWYKPGTKGMAPKISYIKLFKPKNWIIGTGVYIDNIKIRVAQKHAETQQQVNRLVAIIVVIAFLLLGAASLALYRLGDNITTALYKLKALLNDISAGKSVEKIAMKRKDEIGEMKTSVDTLIDGIKAYTLFATKIGEGDYTADFKALSDEDRLGNSLLNMRKSLYQAQQEELNRKREDEKLNWSNIGIAKFNDLLRISSTSVAEISYRIVVNLIDYVKANVGGIYVYSDDNEQDKYLELIASFAFDRRKFEERRFFAGEGLVGTCALEKRTIYFSKLPANYLTISSGLGEARPCSLLLVPLRIDDKILGVIELASFKTLEKHEIKFVEKVGESIAATLLSVKMNQRTTVLLKESKNQAQLLAIQEDEVRKKESSLQELKDSMKLLEYEKDEIIEHLEQEKRILLEKLYRFRQEPETE